MSWLSKQLHSIEGHISHIFKQIGNHLNYVIDAAAIVLSFYLGPEVYAEIGGAVTGGAATGAAASAVGGAVVGGATGALGAAATGGNIAQGAEMGALGGGVGAGVGAEVSNLEPATGTFAAGTAGGKALATGLGSAAGRFATTGNPTLALESGAVGGLASLGASALGGDAGEQRATQTALSQGLNTGLSMLTSPSPTRSSQTAGGSGFSTPVSSSQSPVSGSALSQVLSLGGDPILGGTSDKEGVKRNVWNVNSLRYMGQPDTETNSGTAS